MKPPETIANNSLSREHGCAFPCPKCYIVAGGVGSFLWSRKEMNMVPLPRESGDFIQDAMNETLIGERSMKREKSGRKSGFTTHKRVFYLSLPIMTSISASAGADSPAGRLPTSPPRALAIESAPDPFDPERSTTIVLG